MAGSRRVVHLGEVAGVANTLVSGLRSVGVNADFADLPAPTPDAASIVKIFTALPRLTSAVRIRRDLRATDAIAHVHYATSGIWFMGCHPLIVHCHGDDVRALSGARDVMVRRILDSADMVIAATPDLLKWLPESARYLPNPVDTETFDLAVPVTDAQRDVFVFSVLEDWKGATEILEAVRELKAQNPDIRISAIDHGRHADAFRDAGVDMFGFMPIDELARFVNNHRVILGQRILGVPGTSELQAMACGRPVVMPLSGEVERRHLPPVIDDVDPIAAAQRTLELLGDSARLQKAGNEARQWVRDVHSVKAVSTQLAGWYDELS